MAEPVYSTRCAHMVPLALSVAFLLAIASACFADGGPTVAPGDTSVESPDSPPCSVPTNGFLLEAGAPVPTVPGFEEMAFYDVRQGRVLRTVPKPSGSWLWTSDDLREATIFRNPDLYASDQVQLRWTKPSAPGIHCDAKFDVPDSFVMAVYCANQPADSDAQTSCRAGLTDQIQINVLDLKQWMTATLAADKRLASDTVSDLVPFFDGVPLPGIHPDNPNAQPKPSFGAHSYTTLRFTLVRNDSNKAVWTRLLNRPTWEGRPVEVSIGFENGDPMRFAVLKGGTTKWPQERFWLIVLPKLATVMGMVVILSALVLFFAMVQSTGIVRDSSAPPRPDGTSPYSLARVQMAFWFFLVVASYFLLFLVIKDTDTITPSVLTLIGISAGTALGAAVIDAGDKADATERIRAVAQLDPARPEVEQLRARVSSLRQAFADLNTRAPAATPADQAVQRAEKDRVAGDLALAERQLAFFEMRPWKRVMYDLLGDNGAISFHRFQMFVWTLVLGIVFASRVMADLAMPEFSATVLGLMGISSGTYVGFKLRQT